MMAEHETVFGVNVDGRVTRLVVRRPTPQAVRESDLVYFRALQEAVDAGLMVRTEVGRVMRDQGLWDHHRQVEYDTATTSLRCGEEALAAGVLKPSEAEAVALRMRDTRAAIRGLLAERAELDRHTAESHAERARYEYILVSCVVDADTGRPFFQDVADFRDRAGAPVGEMADAMLEGMAVGLADVCAWTLPENRFRLAHRMVDDKLRLIDRDGRPVDEQGGHVGGGFEEGFAEFVDDLTPPPSPAQPEAPAEPLPAIEASVAV
jgi:hypothetical protein